MLLDRTVTVLSGGRHLQRKVKMSYTVIQITLDSARIDEKITFHTTQSNLHRD